MKIELLVGGIVIEHNNGTGTITSQLHEEGDLCPSLDPDSGLARAMYGSAIDGLEALILAHACAGVNVIAPDYVEGIKTAIDAITNNT